MKTGFIGLGSQGGPMAARMLAGGYPLTIWARRAEVAEEWRGKGAKAAATVAELGANCDHVGICVVADADVEQVCAELIPALARGSRIAIHSTVLPETCARLAGQCAEHGIGLIDAPVSGGGQAAEAGTLTVMCGGDPDVFEACRPVFETFAGLVVLLGPIGAGQHAKLINNALLSAHMGIADAAFAASRALGIDKAALTELIKASSGRSFGFEVCSRLPNPQAFAHGGKLLLKDIKLLQAILPGNPGAEALWQAGGPFLTAANQTETNP